ncbi:MAG: hypothetical protein V4629_11185 [Pseudomonadota bacterium]
MLSIGSHNSVPSTPPKASRSVSTKHFNSPVTPYKASALSRAISAHNMRSIIEETALKLEDLQPKSASYPQIHPLPIAPNVHSFFNMHLEGQIQTFTEDLVDTLNEKIQRSSFEKTHSQVNHAFKLTTRVHGFANTPSTLSKSYFENIVEQGNTQEKFDFIAEYLGNVLNEISHTMINISKESISDLLEPKNQLMDWINTSNNFLNSIDLDPMNLPAFIDLSQVDKFQQNLTQLPSKIMTKIEQHTFADHEANKLFLQNVTTELLTNASKIFIISGWLAQPLVAKTSSSLGLLDSKYSMSKPEFEPRSQSLSSLEKSKKSDSSEYFYYELDRVTSNKDFTDSFEQSQKVSSDLSNSNESEGSAFSLHIDSETLLDPSSHALFELEPPTLSKSPLRETPQDINIADQLTARAGNFSLKRTHSFNAFAADTLPSLNNLQMAHSRPVLYRSPEQYPTPAFTENRERSSGSLVSESSTGIPSNDDLIFAFEK